MIAIVFFAAMLAALAFAVFAFRRGQSRSVLYALTLRVSVSVLFFVLLMVAWWLGWLRRQQPNAPSRLSHRVRFGQGLSRLLAALRSRARLRRVPDAFYLPGSYRGRGHLLRGVVRRHRPL